MASIPGSSRFLGAATLANLKGFAAQAPTLLGESGATSLLDAGRGVSSGGGIGLSSSARALNQQFLNNTTEINALLSLGIGPGATIEGLQGQILALRSSLPQSSLAKSLQDDPPVTLGDDGGISGSSVGVELDEEA